MDFICTWLRGTYFCYWKKRSIPILLVNFLQPQQKSTSAILPVIKYDIQRRCYSVIADRLLPSICPFLPIQMNCRVLTYSRKKSCLKSPDVRLGVPIKLPKVGTLCKVDLPVSAPHKGGVHVVGNAGEAPGDGHGAVRLHLRVDKLPVLVSWTEVYKIVILLRNFLYIT